MLTVAILIGLYSYGIFLFGILGILTRGIIVSYSLVMIITLLLYFRNRIFPNALRLFNFLLKLKGLSRLYLLLVISIALVNFIGALGPETGFDALWYHLTLPKIYLSEHRIFYIPGNLFYYSTMPKLIEMLYISALSFDAEILAKIVHFTLGILSLFLLYKLGRFYLSKKDSLLVVVIFYSNLVVAWQSITAYIDLGRTFFEVLALFFFVSYLKDKKGSTLTKSAISIGLAISTKLLAVGSLFVFIAILLLRRAEFLKITKFALFAILIPSPWFIFSYLNTGNPIYPLFERVYGVAPSLSISNILNFIRSSDPISPIYLITLPFIIVSYKKFDRMIKTIAIYSLFSFLLWLITPQTGGGRFIMPYLPAFSILVVLSLRSIANESLVKYIIGIIIFISIITISYRGLANAKYIPVLSGFEAKHQFLSRNLNFNFGDFYDTDYYFKNNIKTTDRVLIYGTHNLFYVDFPFIHESYLRENDYFNYILTQNASLPERFSSWKLVYRNPRTHVKLYSRN